MCLTQHFDKSNCVLSVLKKKEIKKEKRSEWETNLHKWTITLSYSLMCWQLYEYCIYRLHVFCERNTVQEKEMNRATISEVKLNNNNLSKQLFLKCVYVCRYYNFSQSLCSMPHIHMFQVQCVRIEQTSVCFILSSFLF